VHKGDDDDDDDDDNNNNNLAKMQLGHLLTHSSLTRLEVSVMVFPSSFCLLVFFHFPVPFQSRPGRDADTSPPSSAVAKKE